MRATSAYFAGAATVIAAIAAGLGGGLVLGDIMSPQQPKHPGSEMTRLEQRMSPQPIQASNAAAQTAASSAAPQAATAVAEPQAQPPQQARETQPRQEQPQVQQASTRPAAPATQLAAPQPVTTEQAAARERPAPENSFAKARDDELKRAAHRAEDRRKSERRQQEAEKRKQRQRQNDDLNEVEASVREATEWRPLFGRDPGIGSGRVTLGEPD